MNYGQILSRAWQITWRWKILWVLGFLTALYSSLSSGSNLSYRLDDADLAKWALDLPAWPNAALWLSLIGCGALLLILALPVLSVIATGGLISGVQQIEEEGSTSLSGAWRVGVRRFWRLLGISLLTMLPVLVLAVVAAVLLAMGIVPVASTSDSTAGARTAGILSVVCGGALCCVLIPLGLALTAVATYAQRAAILEELLWIESIKRGWQVFKSHLGPTVLLWLILLALGLAAGVLLGLVAFPVILALVALWQVDGATAWYIGLAVCAGLVGFIVYGLVNAILGTFTSAAWTLAFREITAGAPSATEPMFEPAPEP